MSIPLVLANMCLLQNERNEVLLGRKTKKVGVGLFNAPGGLIEKGETIDDSTVREVQEEIGVTIPYLTLAPTRTRIFVPCAIVLCHNIKKSGEPYDCRIYVSATYGWLGTPRPSSELIDLRWFARDKLPFSEMMAGDREWLPHALEGNAVYAEVFYGPGMEELVRPTEVTFLSTQGLKDLWKLP